MLLCSPEARALPLSVASAARPARLDGLRIGFLEEVTCDYYPSLLWADR